jgi:hypothetical protein
MKPRLLRFALCTAILLVTLPPTARAAALTTSGQVSSVWTGYTGGSVFVGGLGNPGACGNGSLIEFTTTNSDPAKILSIALAAQLAGKNLTCYVNGCGSDKYPIGNQCYMSN